MRVSIAFPTQNYGLGISRRISHTQLILLTHFAFFFAHGARVVVVGNVEELGNWDVTRALALYNAHHPQWRGEVAVSRSGKVCAVYVRVRVCEGEGEGGGLRIVW